MLNRIDFYIGDQPTHIDFAHQQEFRPTDTLLFYLRKRLHLKATREGCGEGDCGACTVVLAEYNNEKINYRAVNACLLLLSSIHGKWLILTEHLVDGQGKLHPIQQGLLDNHAIQCGFCTSGMMMSMLGMYKNTLHPDRDTIHKYMAGNLCRCTGYQSIYDACANLCDGAPDHFTELEPAVISFIKRLHKEDFSYLTEESSYYRPLSLHNALDWYRKYPEATLSAGATDLGVVQYKKGIKLVHVLDLSAVEDLNSIQIYPDRVVVGAAVKIERFREQIKDILPEIYQFTSRFASHQIRNIATLTGNIASASPIGDLTPILLAHHAIIHVSHILEQKSYQLSDFIVDYRKTQLQPGELIHWIEIPIPTPDIVIRSYKLSKRKEVDISSVSMSARLLLSSDQKVIDIELYYGGMSAKVSRATLIERQLIGSPWTQHSIQQAQRQIKEQFTPLSDARATAEGRIIMAENLLMVLWEDSTN